MEDIKFTWINDPDFDKYSPLTQVYGIVFNENGEILIAKKTFEKSWILPGGSPEGNETPEETLTRELIEEADVEGEIIRLGVQKVEDRINPNQQLIYQARCIVLLKKLLPQTPDPDNGEMWDRQFVPSEEINTYIFWGENGRKMFEDAVNLYNKLKIQ